MSRALLVSPVSPWAPTFGAQQRTALVYGALAGIMPVDVLVLTEGGENRAEPGDRPEIVANLLWKQPSLVPERYGIHSWVDAWCRSHLDWERYSIVVGRYLTPISKMGLPSHVRTVVDCDDAVYRYVPRWAGPFGRAAAAAQGWLRYRLTRAAIARYDHVFFCSRRDRDLFPARSSSVLPNAVQLPAQPLQAPEGCSGNVLMVGSMWYAPNRHGIDWFLARCWPEIAARCPWLSLRIVGAAPVRDRSRWAQAPRTEAPGFVEDLDAEYSRALFAIAPIHHGGGTCIKFVEAAAHSRACVATDWVFSGFDPDFRDGYSAVVARGPVEFIERCVALCRDPQQRSEIAHRAYLTALGSYDSGRLAGIVHAAVREVSSRAQTR